MKVYFPLDCSGPLPVNITTNFGDPYKNQAYFSRVEISIINNIVQEIKKFSQQNPNIPLNTEERRLVFLQAVATDKSNSLPSLKEKLNKAVLKNRFVSFHPGVDINLGSGSQDANKPVYAVTNGKILKVGNFCKNDCGKYIFVEHYCNGNKFYALYGHVRSLVNVGQNVTGGQQIARIADIDVFSPHLHFEVTLSPNTYPTGNYIGSLSNMPYSQYVLNLAFVAAVIYDQVLNNQTTFNIDRKYWTLVLVPINNPWTLEPKENSYKYIDPIKFLTNISENKKFYNAVTKNVCTSLYVYSTKQFVTFTS